MSSNNAFAKINQQYLPKTKPNVEVSRSDTKIPLKDTSVSNSDTTTDTTASDFDLNQEKMQKLCNYLKNLSNKIPRSGRTFRIDENLFDKKFKPFLRAVEDLKLGVSANDIYILSFLFVAECHADEFKEILKDNYKDEIVDL